MCHILFMYTRIISTELNYSLRISCFTVLHSILPSDRYCLGIEFFYKCPLKCPLSRVMVNMCSTFTGTTHKTCSPDNMSQVSTPILVTTPSRFVNTSWPGVNVSTRVYKLVALLVTCSKSLLRKQTVFAEFAADTIRLLSSETMKCVCVIIWTISFYAWWR